MDTTAPQPVETKAEPVPETKPTHPAPEKEVSAGNSPVSQLRSQTSIPLDAEATPASMVATINTHVKALKVNEFEGYKEKIDRIERNIMELYSSCTANNQDFSPFNDALFEKIIGLSYKKNPNLLYDVGRMYLKIFTKVEILQKMKNKRIIIDFINALIILIEKLEGLLLSNDLIETAEDIVAYIRSNDAANQYHDILVKISEGLSKKSMRQISSKYSRTSAMVMKLNVLSRNDELAAKVNALHYAIMQFLECNSYLEQIYIFANVLPECLQNLLNSDLANANPHSGYINFCHEVLNVVERFIFPTTYSITIENLDRTLIETKTFSLGAEKQLIQHNPNIYYSLAIILNHMLLQPNEITLSVRVLNIIRRLYYLFPNFRPLLRNPINLAVSNIAAFSTDVNEQKECTIFLYKLLNLEKDPELKALLTQNSYISHLQSNKYYTVKATTYPNDVDIIFNIRTLNLNLFYPLRQTIEAGKFFHINILVERPFSLIYWYFRTEDYDVKFGIYRFKALEDYSPAELEDKPVTGSHEAIIQMTRVDSHKNALNGCTILINPGFYRLVFDNTYSYMRGKTLSYSYHLLQPEKN